MFLSIGMLKQKYFLTDIFILSAEKQPIKLSWRKIEWLPACAIFIYSTGASASSLRYSTTAFGLLIASVLLFYITLKSASNLNGNLNCSKELEHYAS